MPHCLDICYIWGLPSLSEYSGCQWLFFDLDSDSSLPNTTTKVTLSLMINYYFSFNFNLLCGYKCCFMYDRYI
ncbi:hypothetical protein DFH05DRAFT_1467545 [Lentinula detonsa]|uniref:Uncharacterized protein n=1 Tax=Lentinula detonsa TaxID=2804962 RepID=A0A9W8PAZ0_9AGAR|nr:hypothetical protein DFH05DRAFT_1467545 [Lentinula detonsa]